MVSLTRFLRPASPLTGWATPPTTQPSRPTLAEQPPRSGPGVGAISTPGIPEYAGMLYYPREKDRSWQTQQARDETITEMSQDPVLGGVLTAIEMFVRRVPWHLEPADDSEEAKVAAEFYQECLDQQRGFWPGETMAQILTFLAWGWSAVEVVLKRRDDGRIGWDRWRLIPQHTRYRWEFDPRTGDATHLIQDNQYDRTRPGEIRVPLDRCIIFRYASRDNSPEGYAPLRLAWDAYYFKKAMQTLEGILFERFGGLPVGRLPSREIEGNTAAFRAMQTIVTSIKNNAQAGLVLASDRDDKGNYYQEFELKSPQAGATVPTADPIVRRYAQEMVGVFLANVMRTGQDNTGSFALADVHSGLFQQGIAAHLDTIADCIQTQEFPRLARWNGIRPELIPRLKHGDVEEVDLALLGTYLRNLADAGLLAATPKLRQFVHEEAGMPAPTAEEMAAMEVAEAARQEAALERQRRLFDAGEADLGDDEEDEDEEGAA